MSAPGSDPTQKSPTAAKPAEASKSSPASSGAASSKGGSTSKGQGVSAIAAAVLAIVVGGLVFGVMQMQAQSSKSDQVLALERQLATARSDLSASRAAFQSQAATLTNLKQTMGSREDSLSRIGDLVALLTEELEAVGVAVIRPPVELEAVEVEVVEGVSVEPAESVDAVSTDPVQ